MEEIWKDIKGYEGIYKISNFGRVKSFKCNKERILKTTKNKAGYIKIGIGDTNNRKTFYIHRLIAELFIPNPLNKPEINHINGNKSDYRIENLEWINHRENIQHAISILHKNIGKYDRTNIKNL